MTCCGRRVTAFLNPFLQHHKEKKKEKEKKRKGKKRKKKERKKGRIVRHASLRENIKKTRRRVPAHSGSPWEGQKKEEGKKTLLSFFFFLFSFSFFFSFLFSFSLDFFS